MTPSFVSTLPTKKRKSNSLIFTFGEKKEPGIAGLFIACYLYYRLKT